MTFSERVLALTQDKLIPKVVDNVLNSNVAVLRLMGNAKKGVGEAIKKAIKVKSSGSAVSFSGLDTFSASPLDTKVRLSYDMRANRIPVAVSGMEAVANGVAETQVTDMVINSLEESQQELVDFVGDQVYGDGTGNSNKDFIGLGAIVDDGTDVATIGGQSRTTYPVLAATRTASGGTLDLDKLATLYSAISSGGMQSSPTLSLVTETIFDLYESLLTPTVRETYAAEGYYSVGKEGKATRVAALSGRAGFDALSYRGVPMVRDEKCTSQTLWMINENRVDWYGWDATGIMPGFKKVSLGQKTIEGVYNDAPMSEFTGFNWSGYIKPSNQFAMVGEIVLLGNMTSFEPRRHGRLTGITGV
ncbi:MAG: phage major capsid protein [Candidatus Omnitrophica bacterium]|nr:phage major capsid protein [Candidatus Omnitrophota bacterium]